MADTEKTLSDETRLDRMLANLQQYIDQRAAELAQPLIEEAREAAAIEVRGAQGMQQRAEDLSAELRRQIRALERQVKSYKERAEASEAAVAWNAVHPVGTPVLAWPGTRDDEPLVTRTRTPAWTLGHGAAVVSVEGRSGGIALTHIQLIEPSAGDGSDGNAYARVSEAAVAGVEPPRVSR